ncbi:MAG: PQQ-dependent sugar dehydrogenase [Anaerolineae bacterium]|nr:PQQ-dependent sugar dehydrogenase [Anaerolineae bacterium]
MKSGWVVLLLIILVACGGENGGPAATAPIAPERAVATQPPQATAPPPTGTAVATVSATATEERPTAEPEPAPTTAPTEIPAPVGAPVTGITLAPVAEGFEAPTFVGNAGDERLFVVEQRGRIRVVANGQLLPEPFLDIRDQVGSNANEQGLLSVAFHPDYAANGFFFVDYTDRNGDTVISRFQVSDDLNRADPASETILLQIGQPYGNHNGGQLHFSPDGYLYAGMGDGGSAGDPQNHGQNPRTLLGAILRLDVDFAGDGANYGIPPDNPHVGDETARNEVWAIGLRNPWRFSFDRETGDLYIADVGQNQYEEVNFVPAGEGAGLNFGWNFLEGNHCYRDGCDPGAYYAPVAEYAHGEGECSVTGGYVYRGGTFPQMTGNYFYGDYCSGRIWALFRMADGGWTNNEVGAAPGSLTSFGEGFDGELYLTTREGVLYRLELPGGDS